MNYMEYYFEKQYWSDMVGLIILGAMVVIGGLYIIVNLIIETIKKHKKRRK